MLDVALVLNVFDDGDQDARIALPQENSLDVGSGITADEVLHCAVVISEHNHGDIKTGELHLAR